MSEYSEQRKEAVTKLEAKQAAIHAEFRKACEDDDRAYDRLFDDLRDRFTEDMRRLRSQPRPDHSEAATKRDALLARAEKDFEAEVRALYLQYGLTGDSRYS